jgi:hypothetical protein
MGLRTTRAFSIGGRRYKAGDPIELSGKHLRLFQAIGYVEYGPEEYQSPPAPAETEIVEEPALKPRRTYRRRDMKAEE